MNTVFIVVEVVPFENCRILRVFSDYDMALVYGESLVADETIGEFDIYQREVY